MTGCANRRTGFRARGLASLCPESFDLGADVPTATLAARRNKSRVLKVQPLPADLADLLRRSLQDRPAGVPIWGGTWLRPWRPQINITRSVEMAPPPSAWPMALPWRPGHPLPACASPPRGCAGPHEETGSGPATAADSRDRTLFLYWT
jgi:hypothetical protein